MPPLAEGLLPRTQLVESLDSARHKTLTLLTAPAGSGKTDLINLWRSHNDHISFAWYSLDDSDNERELFYRHLHASIESALGDSDLWLAPSISTDDIFQLVESRKPADDPLVVCLDNVHHLQAQDLLGELAALINDPLCPIHWILLSQQQLSFDTTPLQLRGEITKFDSRQLNFTRADIETLCERNGQSSAFANAVYQNTQGWIAGATLSLVTGQWTQADTPGQPPSPQTVDLFQHLATNKLPTDVIALIKAAAIANPINAELADTINQTDTSSQAISYLLKRCLFIQPLDHQDNWYQIHPLFFSALTKELSSNDIGAIKAQHLRAGHWLVEHQIFEDGLTHLQRSEDTAAFDQQLEHISEQWLLSGNLKPMLYWCEKIPPDRLFRNITVLAQYTLCLTLSFNMSQAIALLDTFDELNEGNQTHTDSLQVCRQLTLLFEKDSGFRSTEVLQRTRQNLLLKERKTRLEQFILGTITNIAAMQAYLSFDHQKAKSLAIEGKRHHRLANSIHGECYSEYLDILQDFVRGQNSILAVERLRHFITSKHLQTSDSCWVQLHIVMAPMLYELNQHDLALDYCRSVFNDISADTHLDTLVYFYLTYSKLLHRHQQSEQADRLLSNLHHHRSLAQNGRAIAILAFEKLRQAMLNRDKVQARRIYQTLDIDNRWPLDHWNNVDTDDPQEWAVSGITQLTYLTINGNYAHAQKLLDKLRAFIKSANNHYMHSILLALQIEILWASKKTDSALSLLAQTLEQVDKQGYYCVLRDHIPSLDVMIKQLVQQQLMPPHLHPDLMRDLSQPINERPASSNTPQIRSQPSPLIEPLTKRELVLLSDIANGLSNQEISEKRFVAISTVKWHLKNVYAKLDAKHRAQAIARARDLKLID